jgi:hypothetical protein
LKNDDYYRFVLKSAESASFNITPHVNQGQLRLYIYAPYNNQLDYTGQMGNDVTGTINLSALSGGT